MIAIVRALDLFLAALRPALFALAVVLAIVALVDWLVRTRRIAPFGAVGRFTRRWIDPLFAPVSRAVLRRGGLPADAPWYALGAAVVAGVVLLSLLGFLRDQIATAAVASSRGMRDVVRLLISWAFAFVQIALIVRVLCSWFPISPYSRWVHWAFVVTEPILAPLRRVVPAIGMIDITPIIAYFLLWLLKGLLFGLA